MSENLTDVPGFSWNQNWITTVYDGNDGRTPRFYTNREWYDIEPGDVDLWGNEHPVKFLIVHKPYDNDSEYALTAEEKQYALHNLGISKATADQYGLVKYTNDWRDSAGGDPGDQPLTLTRSAIIDLFNNTAEEDRDSIMEYSDRAVQAQESAIQSALIAQEAADTAQMAYGGYTRLSPVEPYLYEAWYGTLDYKYAFDHYSSSDAGYGIGACSSVRNGDFFGRNYDWTYDSNAEFIVHTAAQDGRHAVLGTAASVTGLTDSFVKSGQASPLYKLVPFQLVDGINDAGLVMNMNVVPLQALDQEHYPDVELDRDTNKYIYPIGGEQDEKIRLSIMMLPRFVLDMFSGVTEAINWLQENATIYFPDKLLDMGYEIHCLLADKNTTKCIEFINGAISVVNINYITNFHVTGVQFNNSGKLVYTPVDASDEQSPKYPSVENNIEKYGSGLERINILHQGYSAATSLSGMKSLMESIYYSRAYSGNNWEEPTEETRWYTEFVETPVEQGSTQYTTVDTNIADFTYALGVVDDRFINRNRSVPGAWQTTHSIIYDIKGLKAHIAVQEADKTSIQYHTREIEAAFPVQEVLASVNAGQNISIHDKGSLYQYKPEISAAGFNGDLDNDMHIGCGEGGQAAACLLGVGNPQAAGQLLVKYPGTSTFENLATFDIIGGRTVAGIVNDLNHDVHCHAFQQIATASVYPGGFIKITQKQAGSAGNDYVFKTGSPASAAEQIQFPCFGECTIQQGSLVPGRDAQTNYDLTVNGDSVLLENHVSPQIQLVAGTVLKNNRVYILNRPTGTVQQENWQVQEGATAEIYIDYTGGAIVLPAWWWIDGTSSASGDHDIPPWGQSMETNHRYVVTVRNDGRKVVANVQYDYPL